MLYLLKRVYCLLQAGIQALKSTKPEGNEYQMTANMYASRALSCFAIGLLFPFVFGVAIPTEMIRFFTRTLSSIQEAFILREDIFNGSIEFSLEGASPWV